MMAIRIVWYGTELLSHRRRAVTIYDQVTDYGRMDGHIALQIAKAMGHGVLAITNSPGKAGDARKMGADEVLVVKDHVGQELQDKTNNSGTGVDRIRNNGGILFIENVSLKRLIATAFDVPEWQNYLFSAPDWLDSKNFDVQTRFPDTPRLKFMQMFQRLLEERFSMVFHREPRSFPCLRSYPARKGRIVSGLLQGIRIAELPLLRTFDRRQDLPPGRQTRICSIRRIITDGGTSRDAASLTVMRTVGL
jgi:hypothetical protein